MAPFYFASIFKKSHPSGWSNPSSDSQVRAIPIFLCEAMATSRPCCCHPVLVCAVGNIGVPLLLESRGAWIGDSQWAVYYHSISFVVTRAQDWGGKGYLGVSGLVGILCLILYPRSTLGFPWLSSSVPTPIEFYWFSPSPLPHLTSNKISTVALCKCHQIPGHVSPACIAPPWWRHRYRNIFFIGYLGCLLSPSLSLVSPLCSLTWLQVAMYWWGHWPHH